jgi:hypothetical protein
VQAALASDPLESIRENKKDEPNYEEWEQWAGRCRFTL